jgi:transcription initiation factor TFIIB
MHSQHRSTASVPTARQFQISSTDKQRPQSPSIQEGRVCPNCSAHIETIDISEAVCPDCDIVVTPEPISTAPRPRYNDEDDTKRQSGSRLTWLYADRGLGAGVDSGATNDGQGTPLSETQRRLTRDTGWTKHLSPRDSRLDYALGEIRRMGSELGIPTSELEQAARLYRQAHAGGHITGRSVDGFAAACLLVAVRQSSLRLPASQREIQNVSRATSEQLRTARGVLEVRLSVEIPPMDPRDFLPRAASRLSAPWRVKRCAIELLNAHATDEENFRGISPRTLAAAALHAAFDLVDCADRPKLSEISEILDVSQSTISERKNHVLEHREAWRQTKSQGFDC